MHVIYRHGASEMNSLSAQVPNQEGLDCRHKIWRNNLDSRFVGQWLGKMHAFRIIGSRNLTCINFLLILGQNIRKKMQLVNNISSLQHENEKLIAAMIQKETI